MSWFSWEVRIKYQHWLPRFLKVNAITLAPFILMTCSREDVPNTTLWHELIHIAQIRRLGILRFYLLYFLFYVANLLRYLEHDKAYREIPFEQEAYENSSSAYSAQACIKKYTGNQ